MESIDLLNMLSDKYSLPISREKSNLPEHGYYYITVNDTDEETVRAEIMKEIEDRGLNIDLDAYTNILTGPDNTVLIRISY